MFDVDSLMGAIAALAAIAGAAPVAAEVPPASIIRVAVPAADKFAARHHQPPVATAKSLDIKPTHPIGTAPDCGVNGSRSPDGTVQVRLQIW